MRALNALRNAALRRAVREQTRRTTGAVRAPKPKDTAPDRNRELELMLRASGIGGWEREYRFALPERQFRFDFAWPAQRFAVEVDGGNFQGGRHVRPVGLINDYEKQRLWLLRGWNVYRIYPRLIQKSQTIELIRHFVGDGGAMPAQGDLLGVFKRG